MVDISQFAFFLLTFANQTYQQKNANHPTASASAMELAVCLPWIFRPSAHREHGTGAWCENERVGTSDNHEFLAATHLDIHATYFKIYILSISSTATWFSMLKGSCGLSRSCPLLGSFATCRGPCPVPFTVEGQSSPLSLLASSLDLPPASSC